ncbi:DUF3575 domain-containing protein [Emticicia sp. BO119]|uniref:DUF3575 domain-containing protein n=1 Tax=Emticicia sp. BO119 TaxID=2757768 RepID=UPI0015EFF269|nr:DUF3575 domain-containing protein [Emticicia sp. BO119]MBA4853313.1 DUF3575 domain-containing protein [Emticicia sp. BO119]
MKIASLTVFCVCFSFFCYSQESNSSVLKVNLSALTLGAYSLQYEKALGNRISFALGVAYRPVKIVPFAKTVESFVDAADKRIDYISLVNVKKSESTAGNFGLTPELRFYLGKNKSAPIGTYIAVFGRYNSYFGKAPVFVDMLYKETFARIELPVDTQVKTYSGGLMIGKQFRLGNRFTFDWFIIGGHYGRVTVHGESKQNLEGYDEQFIKDLKEKIIDTFKINEQYLSLEVDKQGVRLDNARNLSFFNLRGLGFNIGYRF